MGNAAFVIPISITQYLVMTGQGRATNQSFTVPAGATVTDVSNPIAPDSGHHAVFVSNIEFDAIQAGQVGYSLELDGGNTVAGYALQGKDVIELQCVGPLRYSIQNNATTVCVVNIDYVSLDWNTYQQLRSLINTMVSSPLSFPKA